MASTVDDIQSRVAAIVDQDESTTNISTADYSLRLNYINRREMDWAEKGKWQSLYKEFNTQTSTVSGNTSVSLPSDFRSLAGFPQIVQSNSVDIEFPEVRGQEEPQFISSDRYVKILGNPADGYTMVVHGGNENGQLVSGASIFVSYFKSPASLISPANVVTCPNPEYLVKGVIADVWKAREDARAELQDVEADQVLANMLEFEFTPSEAANYDRVKSVEVTRHNYRWGRD